MNDPVSPAEVAAWMAQQVEEHGYLDQEVAASTIPSKFGDEFVYENDNGNPAISRKVLKAFRTLTQDTVVWDREERSWLRRSKGDGAGRQVK